MVSLVFISFSRNTKMCSCTADCDRMSSTYSYVAHGIRMTHLIHVLCACGQPWGLHGDAVLVDHSGHSPLTLTHLIQNIMTIFHKLMCPHVASAAQHQLQNIMHMMCFLLNLDLLSSYYFQVEIDDEPGSALRHALQFCLPLRGRRATRLLAILSVFVLSGQSR